MNTSFSTKNYLEWVFSTAWHSIHEAVQCEISRYIWKTDTWTIKKN